MNKTKEINYMDDEMKYDIAVIGGGASGLICAISASMIDDRHRICILERMDRVGKKLLATGNGRCNITNRNEGDQFYHGYNREMINSVLRDFGYKKTIGFFETIGLLCKEEDGGRIYPYCMQASAVLEVLRNYILKRGIIEKCNFEVSSIRKQDGKFIITSGAGEEIYAKRVVLATGGQAAPNLGSNGSGYMLAESLGHRLTKRYPALVQLKSNNPQVKSLNGIRVSGEIYAVIDGKKVKQETGEVLFTGYGLSGIPIMQLSYLYGSKEKEADMQIIIDLMPEYSAESLIELLISRRDNAIFDTLETFLIGLINKKVGYVLLKNANLSPLSKLTNTLTDKQIHTIVNHIKNYEFNIIGDMSWPNSQVTAGGIDSREFNEKTLESSIVKGLYACGELLDVFSDCGGYNLQWAWATGFICGMSSAKSLL